MDDFTIFEYRDKDGKSLVKKIGKTPIEELRKWMGPQISKFEIAIIWAISNNETDFREFLHFYNFRSDENLEKDKQSFIKNYNIKVGLQKKSQKDYKKFLKQVDKSSKKFKDENTISDFNIVKMTVLAEIDPEELSLDPTENVPLYKTPYWTKIWRQYEDFEEIKDFINQTSQNYIFKIPGEDIGYIDLNNETIEFTTHPRNVDNTLDIISTDLNANIIDYQQLKINGNFMISKYYFDRNIAALMLVDNAFYGNRIFINESGEVLSKKVKEGRDDIKTVGRFTLTYYKYGPEFSSPVFITFTNKEKDMIVSIAKILNEEDIDDVMNVAMFILKEYSRNESEMNKLFKQGVPDFKIQTVKKQTVQKEKKTKLRINELRAYDPELFREEYPRMCQGPKKQPLIATKDQIKQLKGTNKILEYPFESGKYYVCADPDRPYPGILVNKRDDNPTYKYVPCCYPRSQQGRVSKFQAEDAGLVPKKVVVKDYIFEAEKKLEEGRQGKISEVLKQVLNYHHMDQDNFIRYGVKEGPQSIIDAMALIQDYEKWVNNPDKARKSIIKKLKGSDMLNAGLQSYSREYLEKALEKNKIIKTANFHPVVEYFFKAVVVVIQGSDLARPDAYFGFIPHLRKRKNLILLYQHKDSDQVEVIGTYDKNFIHTSARVISEFLKTKRQVYGFFSGKGYSIPRITKISSKANKQYVDSFGKTRGFLVNGQSIYTIPFAPTSKPLAKEPKIGDTKKILKKFKLTPKYFETNVIYTDQFVLPSNNSFKLDTPPQDYIKPYILSLSDFVERSAKSENDAYEIMKGEKAPPKNLRKEVKQWKSTGVKLPPLDKIEISSPKVVTLFTQLDEEDYLESLKTRPNFKWQKLWRLEHVPEKIHWVLNDSEAFVVKDLSDEPDGEVGYGVVEDKKIGDGDVVVYPDDLFGIVEN
jgi:hypothetical protein